MPQLDPVRCEEDGTLQKIINEHGYNYTEVITVCPEKLPNYEDKVQYLFTHARVRLIP